MLVLAIKSQNGTGESVLTNLRALASNSSMGWQPLFNQGSQTPCCWSFWKDLVRDEQSRGRVWARISDAPVYSRNFSLRDVRSASCEVLPWYHGGPFKHAEYFSKFPLNSLYVPSIFFIIIADYQAICVKELFAGKSSFCL